MIISDKNKRLIKRFLDAVHYDYGHWARTVMYRECFRLVRELEPSKLEALEISAGHIWRTLGFKSFTEANFPEFDVCSMTLPKAFDLIIADQVFEHLLWPYRAGRNVHSMLKPGGHLAACAGTLFAEPTGCDGMPPDAVSARPAFLILLYPVISFVESWAHAGSRRALLGDDPSPALAAALSLERRVNRETPPSFLVHAEDDTVVPPENSRSFHAALCAAGVASELHVFASGFHGFGLGADAGPATVWPERCATWLRAGGWLPPAAPSPIISHG